MIWMKYKRVNMRLVKHLYTMKSHLCSTAVQLLLSVIHCSRLIGEV